MPFTCSTTVITAYRLQCLHQLRGVGIFSVRLQRMGGFSPPSRFPHRPKADNLYIREKSIEGNELKHYHYPRM